MATGALSGGVCYESLSLATDSYFSALPPSSALDAATGITTQNSLVNTAGVWYRQQVSVSSAGVSSLVYSVPAVSPTFPACYAPSEAFADGVNIGWAFAACMVIIVFVMAGKRLIHA